MSRSTASTQRDEADRLRRLVQAFVRRFGLLLGNHTPCGQAVSPSHAHALMVLLERTRERGAALCQADLGLVLGIDKSNVARVCARMEKMGHIEQTRASHDGRSRLVSLKPAGARLARSVERSSRERFERLLDDIPRPQRALVLDGLAVLDAALASPPSGAQ